MNRRDYKPVYGPYPDLERLRQDLELAFEMIERGKRGSGRTARMLEGVTPDTRVVIGPVRPDFMHRALRDAGHRATKVFQADPRKRLVDLDQAIMGVGTSHTLFDHTWVTERLRALIDDAIGQVAWEMDQVTCRPFRPFRRSGDHG